MFILFVSFIGSIPLLSRSSVFISKPLFIDFWILCKHYTIRSSHTNLFHPVSTTQCHCDLLDLPYSTFCDRLLLIGNFWCTSIPSHQSTGLTLPFLRKKEVKCHLAMIPPEFYQINVISSELTVEPQDGNYLKQQRKYSWVANRQRRGRLLISQKFSTPLLELIDFQDKKNLIRTFLLSKKPLWPKKVLLGS